MSDVITRFMTKVSIDEDTGCWLWTSSKNRKGYGLFWFEKKYWAAHRWSYVRFNGEIENDLTVDHQCDTPACVNPKHLVLASRVDNTMRGNSPHARNARKTQCNRGHSLSGSNVKVYSRKNGKTRRDCVACHRMTSREYQANARLKKSSASQTLTGKRLAGET